MVLTAGRRLETARITRDTRRVFPREWDAFAAQVPLSERDGDLSAAYARLLAVPDHALTEHAAEQWCIWEDTHVSLAAGWQPALRYRDSTFRQVFARLVTHYYWANGLLPRRRADPVPHEPHRRHPRRPRARPVRRLRTPGHSLGPASGMAASRLVVCADDGHGGRDMLTAVVGALDDLRGSQ